MLKNQCRRILQDGINHPPPGDIPLHATLSPKINASEQKNITIMISWNFNYHQINLPFPVLLARIIKNPYLKLFCEMLSKNHLLIIMIWRKSLKVLGHLEKAKHLVWDGINMKEFTFNTEKTYIQVISIKIILKQNTMVIFILI